MQRTGRPTFLVALPGENVEPYHPLLNATYALDCPVIFEVCVAVYDPTRSIAPVVPLRHPLYGTFMSAKKFVVSELKIVPVFTHSASPGTWYPAGHGPLRATDVLVICPQRLVFPPEMPHAYGVGYDQSVAFRIKSESFEYGFDGPYEVVSTRSAFGTEPVHSAVSEVDVAVVVAVIAPLLPHWYRFPIFATLYVVPTFPEPEIDCPRLHAFQICTSVPRATAISSASHTPDFTGVLSEYHMTFPTVVPFTLVAVVTSTVAVLVAVTYSKRSPTWYVPEAYADAGGGADPPPEDEGLPPDDEGAATTGESSRPSEFAPAEDTAAFKTDVLFVDEAFTTSAIFGADARTVPE